MNPVEKSLEAVKNCITLLCRTEIKGNEAPVVADCLRWLECCKAEYDKEIILNKTSQSAEAKT